MKDRTNEQWVAALRGPGQDEAISDLRVLLVRGLRAALGRRRGISEAILEDFAQEALIKILDNLDSFRGESRFTTWAQKISVRVAFTELRRKEWQNVSLQDITNRYDTTGPEPREMADPQPAPEELATRQVVYDTVRRLVYEELTERQQEAIVAVMLNGMPLEEAARRMETNRNALYKLMYDARKKLKAGLISEGISPQDVSMMFGGG
ncbi:MAG: RNA polymerase sigma factor [Rubrobacteraceae bacterium]